MAQKITKDTIKEAILQVLSRYDNDSIQEADWSELAEEAAVIACTSTPKRVHENMPTFEKSDLRTALARWFDVYDFTARFPDVDWLHVADRAAHDVKPDIDHNTPASKWRHSDGVFCREVGFENSSIIVDGVGVPLRFSPHDDARKRAAYFEINQAADVVRLSWGKRKGHQVSFSLQELGPKRFTFFANLFGYIRGLMRDTSSLNQVHLEKGE